jgi:hypothetical protein
MITILTSIYKGDLYIEHFLKNITKCNNYSKCEHLIFNIVKSNSDYLTQLLYVYSRKYKNIKVIHIKEDPGLYEVWNRGIKMSKNTYLLTLNIDDMISNTFLDMTYDYLNKNPEINLVCTPVIVSSKLNSDNFKDLSKTLWTQKYINSKSIDINKGKPYDTYPIDKELLKLKLKIKETNLYNKTELCYYDYFDKYDMIQIIDNKLFSFNIPHCCPVWRKSLHDKYGYFNEKEFGPCADYEFWLRCINDTIFGLIQDISVIYYLNPISHNIVNKDELKFNKIIYKYFGISNITSSSLNYINYQHKKDVSFHLGNQTSYMYGNHRAGWMYVIENIHKNINPIKNSIYLDSFIERTFVWGNEQDTFTYKFPWIGILHNPPNIPDWFESFQSFDSICKKDNFIQSLQYCKKIYTLSKYLADWLSNNSIIKKYKIKVDYLYHPTENTNVKFNYNKFIENEDKKILQIGWWLRKFHMIYMLPKMDNYTKYILGCNRKRFKNLLNKEKEYIKDDIDYSRYNVNYMEFVNNMKYDELLSCNIVFLYLYDTSANNIVIECIMRHTPILVNKIGGIVEYLGEEYPYYYETIKEATSKLLNYDLIKQTHEYLKTNKKIQLQINMRHFIYNINEFITI